MIRTLRVLGVSVALVLAQYSRPMAQSDWWLVTARSFGVVVRSDLPTIGTNGFEGRDKGKAHVEIDVDPDGGWKATTGLFGRDQPTSGTMPRGEIVQMASANITRDPRADPAAFRVDVRIVSTEAHDFVLNVRHREQKRHEPLGILLRLNIPASFGPFLPTMDRIAMALDPYVRLFPTQDAARQFARTLDAPSSDERFTVGVVRRDGILVPFVSYDAGHWFRRWPTPAAESGVPIALKDVPAEWWGLEGAAQAWTLWTENGQSRPLRIAGAIGFGAHCQMQVGLRTDYRSPQPLPPLDQHHYPKDGLATTGPVRLEPIVVAHGGDVAWSSIEKMLATYITREENRLAARNALAAPIMAGVRAATPINLEVLCLANGSAPGAVTLYFEATKRYAPADPSAPNPCGPVTFASGWVHRNASSVGTFDVRSTVQATDCTQWNVVFRKPLGVVHLGGTPVWFLQSSQWGRESYDVVRVDRTGIVPVLAVPGGWCKTIGN